MAYNQALLAGHQLVECSKALAQEPSSREAPILLQKAARGILEGTMKVKCRLAICIATEDICMCSCVSIISPGDFSSQVLLVWDEAEVRKIICAAHWTLDRLELVKVAKSMRSLVICFGVCEKRQRIAYHMYI